MRIVSRGFSGKTILMTLAWLSLILVLLEIPARSQAFGPILPEKGFGSPNRQFEIQYARLQDRADKEGKIDCIFIGNSHVLRAINPEIIEQIYFEETGKKIICQNFGLRGTSVGLNTALASILIKNFHPQLILMSLSMVDMDSSLAGKGDKSILQSPWVKYQQGEFAPEGFLIEHLHSYQYYLGFNSVFSGGARLVDLEGQTFEDNILENGFNPSNNVYGTKVIDPLYVEQMKPVYEKLKIDQSALKAVDQFWELADRGAQVMMIEAPTTMSSITISPTVMEHHQDFLKSMQAISASHGREFIPTYELDIIPQNGWSDHNHLNWRGAEAFSRWLAEQIVLAAQAGTIRFE